MIRATDICDVVRCFRPALSGLVLVAAVSVANAQSPNMPTPAVPPSSIPASSPTGPSQKYVPGDIKTADVHALTAPPKRAVLPPTVPAGRRSVGLALEGGGALGLAHIGVLKWMEEHHVPVDRIAGTSMGCLISALYATGHTPQEMASLTESDLFRQVLTLRSAYSKSSFRRKQDQFEMPEALTIGLKNGLNIRNSLLADESLNSFLTVQLFTYDREGIDFDRLPIPLRCVATDLNTREPVVFDGGPVPVAVRASIAIPGVFAPVSYQGHSLVDGAIMDNLPTDLVKANLQSDVVLAVHLKGLEATASNLKSLVGIFAGALSAATAMNERRSELLADQLVTVDTTKYSVSDYAKAQQLIEEGYASAEASKAQLLAYALGDDDWAAYLADRQSRQHVAPGVLTALRVEGQAASARAAIAHDLRNLTAKPMQPNQIAERLTQEQADGSLHTKFETFAPDDPNGSKRPIPAGPDTGLLVQFQPVPTGPPFLLLGPELAGQTNNVFRAISAFRVVDQNLGGYGSELRTDIRLGYLTSLSSEYYRRLGPNNYYVQPRLMLDRRPIYIWQNQQRVGEEFQQMAGGSLDAGRTFDNQLQMHASWTAQVVRWRSVSGVADGPSISGTSQTALMHVDYDGAGSSTVSGNGIRFNVAAGSLYRGPKGERAPLFQLYALKSINLGARNILAFSGEANTYFRQAVSQPIRFTLGGPFRLSASSLDEYRGTDIVLQRAAFLHQIATLPTGFGQGVYVTFAYEGGEVWSPERTAILRQNIVAAVVAATPVGAISFGTAVGDAGRRKVIFTFGRIF